MHPCCCPESLWSNFTILSFHFVITNSNLCFLPSFYWHMNFVLICFPKLQENSEGILKSPSSSFLHGYFNEQDMGINSLYSFLTPKRSQKSPITAFDSLGHQVSLSLVPEISLPGIFHSPFWWREHMWYRKVFIIIQTSSSLRESSEITSAWAVTVNSCEF